MDKKPKSINGLMKYLRTQKGMKIQGSSQKLKLTNMGYYHGYKGYRYINNPNNIIPYSDFSELNAIYNFDLKLKSLLYPHVMFIETALKNRVLEVLIDKTHSSRFGDIYSKILIDYKSFSTTGKIYATPNAKSNVDKEFKKALKRRLELRDKIYRVQTQSFAKGNRIVEHFYNNHQNLPIWSIFELLSLGEFGHFLSCIEINTRLDISKKLGIRVSDDANGKLTEQIVYTIRDLRNAIAHNDVIFDTRFKTRNISKQLKSNIKNSTSIANINFESITDYIILMTYILKLLGVTKIELKKFITEFQNMTTELKAIIPSNIYNQIIPQDTPSKLIKITNYIK